MSLEEVVIKKANDNAQQSSSNTSTQSNRNDQVSDNGNANSQRNTNSQVSTALVTSPSSYLHTASLEDDWFHQQELNFRLLSKERVDVLYTRHSFWSNIVYLQDLRRTQVFPDKLIDDLEDRVVSKAVNSSKFNEVVYNMNTHL